MNSDQSTKPGTDSEGLSPAAAIRTTTPAGSVSSQEASADVVALQQQIEHYKAALSHISQGVCLFDGARRLTLCNDRYYELYRLRPEQVAPGATLREIVEARCAVGTSPVSAEEYLRISAEINSVETPTSRLTELPDGRLIYVSNQRLPDGGWVSTHEDVTELTNARAVAKEHISVQSLIDLVPDYLWVKDTESRFVIVNRALATDTHYPRTSDMIGVSDAQLHAPELAQEFRAIEVEIMRSGVPLIDREELVTDEAGAKKWVSSTKVPLRNERNEVIGLVGIARDVTARKLAASLQEGQVRILEAIVEGTALEDILDQIVMLVEGQSEGLLGAILLLDDGGSVLRRGAAPSVSEPFVGQAEGIRVGPSGASCGAAVHRREMVVVADILHDPLWDDYRHIAGAHGFRSCWSKPIIAHSGKILGTFSVYSRSVREPVDAELRLIEFAARLSEIAIERAHRPA